MPSRFDVVIGWFGYGRTLLGEWPHTEIVAAAIAVIEENGGVAYEETGSPSGEHDNIRFRLRGRTVRLCVFEFGTRSGSAEACRRAGRKNFRPVA